MRSIPPELLNRIKKKWQVPAENADPKLKVMLSRGFINELFQVFTIQEGSTLEDVDVTVKRTDTSNEPAEAFALALDNGTATVKSKPLPYDDQLPWIDEFTAATGVSAVAIEFDGYWYRDPGLVRFNFVTEDYPWLFYVQGGTLMARYWQDAAFVLSTDVVKVASIRGWIPANGVSTNDQGLIVAYIKTDGNMYYRSYCLQPGLNKLWELERQVTAFTGSISNLALFRTNDYRVGFMAEIAGDIWWTVTNRNYANMAIEPHFVSAGITDVKVNIIPITFTDTYLEHKISVGVNDVKVCFSPEIYPQVISISNPDEFTIEIETDLPLYGDLTGLQSYFIVTDSTGTQFSVLSTMKYEERIILTLNNFSSASGNMTVVLNEQVIFSQVEGGCMMELTVNETFTPELTPPEGYSDHNISVGITDVLVDFKKIDYIDGHTEHSVTVGITDVSVTFIHIDDINP